MVSASASRPAAAAAGGKTLPFHRLSASITSWFRLPEQVCVMVGLWGCVGVGHNRSVDGRVDPLGSGSFLPRQINSCSQGMPHYEMLCRGTAFCVQRPSASHDGR